MKIADFADDLRKARTTQECDKALQNYFHALNINTFVFTYYAYHPRSKNKIKYEFVSDNLKSWHHHYVEENYDYIDTTLDKTYQSTLPIFWDLEKQIKDAKTAREKKMRMDSIKYGTDKGISIPIHGPHNDFAILLVEQLKGEHCLEERHLLQYELLSAAHFYYHYIRKLFIKASTKDEAYQLSKREIQCLTLIAQDYSVADVAKALHITERTVNFHVQNINQKLGSKNKYQSVAKALEEKLLSL